MGFADAGEYELEALEEDPQETPLRRYSAQVEDLYWSGNYWKEPYYRADFDYEDYAPAYCVGYTGCAQYGGCFEDAESSLCANFVRIKGDSRLDWDQARPAVLAAWQRVEAASLHGLDWRASELVAQAIEERCAV